MAIDRNKIASYVIRAGVSYFFDQAYEMLNQYEQ